MDLLDDPFGGARDSARVRHARRPAL